MRSPGRTALAALSLVTVLVTPSLATVPGGIDITCDVPRTGPTNFRTAALGQTAVTFRLWSAATGGTQLGPDYAVPMTSLAVAKRYTDKYDSLKPRKAIRINAVIGSDASPVLLPVDGQAWLEVVVNTTILGCDFAATGDATARRRLQSVAFSRESEHSETCEMCTSTADISALVERTVSALSVPDSTPTVVTWDTEQFDTDNIHDLTINPSRLTANMAGRYQINCFIPWVANPTGVRYVGIKANGATYVAIQSLPVGATNGNGNYVSVEARWPLNAGEYAECEVYQTSGGTLTFSIAGNPSGKFGMVKLP